jgi:sulfite oxidase
MFFAQVLKSRLQLGGKILLIGSGVTATVVTCYTTGSNTNDNYNSSSSLWKWSDLFNKQQTSETQTETSSSNNSKTEEKVYTRAEVSKHNTTSDLWITYKDGVYDVTAFQSIHPGGADKLLMAAGGAVDPFWAFYPQHSKDHVQELLQGFRIGTLDAKEAAATASELNALSDPYVNDPKRHPALRPITQRPYNAETPTILLTDAALTPQDLLFTRNHLPVPDIKSDEHEIIFELDESAKNVKKLRQKELEDTKKYKRYEVEAALQCAGNRRANMQSDSPKGRAPRGLEWGVGAIGNGVWSGILLRDVLLSIGIKDDDVGKTFKHVTFEGLDGAQAAKTAADAKKETKNVEEGKNGSNSKPLVAASASFAAAAAEGYATSIPADVAMDPKRKVLLAFEYNGQPLSRDHGYPVRVIVPGSVAARQVKWLGRVSLSLEECKSSWQKKDYKAFPQSMDWDTVKYDSMPSMHDMPVQSAITSPCDGAILPEGQQTITAKGWAWSGSGRSITRVDVSSDGGKSWVVADISHRPIDNSPSQTESYGWTLWEANLPLASTKTELVVKALDSSLNTQPEKSENIWNWRGIANNAWHRINISGNKSSNGR